MHSTQISFNSCINPYRYGFNGKEQNVEIYASEGTSYDFGERMYDARLGKFLSIDPLTKKYPYFSPYLFAANNPIRFIDFMGMGPGDLFSSPNEAAIDWGMTYNDNSIKDNKEYGSTIFKVVTADGVVKYTYTIPNVSKSDEVVTPSKGDTKFKDRVATVHSHAAYDKSLDHTKENVKESQKKDNNNEFSYEDETNATNSIVRKPIYVATPSGELKKFDAKVHKPGESETISTELPSDDKSPNRANEINFAPLPKNEPFVQEQ
jgi:RHS repeat-associated protein